MPIYTYRARDQRGQAVTGTMTASTPEALADSLKRTGYLVTQAREVAKGVSIASWLQQIGYVSYDELVLFNLQLSKLIQVGIPLLSALRTLEAQTQKRRLRMAIADVAGQVEAGSGFSEALQRHPRIFSTLFVSMVRAGEVSGKLDDILSRLAEFGQRQAELREQLKTALTYPCLLLVVGIMIMAYLVTGIIPKFMQIFVDAHVVLPLPTRLLYQLSELIRHGWVGLLLGAVALIAALRWWIGTPIGRRAFDAWLLGLPIIGGLARDVALSRFARTLSTLAMSGVPILESLTIVEQTIGNVVMAEAVRAVQVSVRQGAGLAQPLKARKEFPPIAVQMIAVGETSGTLDRLLADIADHYDLLARHGIKRATAFVEPLFLAIMGGMVAFIMSSILLPLFRLVNVVH